jgi:NAD(P)-dependent dehydrogenase (short-subunit alcohol dehydrogenase family)
MADKKTAIITGASHGIGAGLVEGFLRVGYNVVATALNASESPTASTSLVLIDGEIGKQETATKAVEAAIMHFGTICLKGIQLRHDRPSVKSGTPLTEWSPKGSIFTSRQP